MTTFEKDNMAWTPYSVNDLQNEFTDEQISILVKEMENGNKFLEAENEMFEHFISRVVPSDELHLAAEPVDTGSHGGSRGENVFRGRRSRGTSAKPIDKLLSLSLPQKCKIALKEIQVHRDEMAKCEGEFERAFDGYQALIEEAEVCLAEIRKERYEFEREIVKGAKDVRMNIIKAEKCMKYFEQKLKYRDLALDKIRVKYSTLKARTKKVKHQLKLKTELGEVLHPVDFNQLKIQNEEHLEKIEERNQDLLRLKLMAGESLKILNSFKRKLHSLTRESDRLQSEINTRTDLQRKIEAETQSAENERIQAEHMNRKLRSQMTNFHIPHVMEYIVEKTELCSLKNKVKIWERKVYMAEMAYKSHQRTLQKMWTGAKMLAIWRKKGKIV